MHLELFGSPISPYVRAVRVAAAEKRIKYELLPIGPDDLRAPGYTRRHPFRKLPSLAIGEDRIYETSAILRFIDEHFESGRALQPADPVGRAHSEQWLSAANSYLYDAAFTGLYFATQLAPGFGITVNQEQVAASIDATRRHLAIVGEALAAGELRPASDLQLGGILTASILVLLRDFEDGRSLLSEVPIVNAWLRDVSQLRSFQSTQADVPGA
ncbi:MAG: glutathione S-transferase family protein [Pseudomonadota bacterium]